MLGIISENVSRGYISASTQNALIRSLKLHSARTRAAFPKGNLPTREFYAEISIRGSSFSGLFKRGRFAYPAILPSGEL